MSQPVQVETGAERAAGLAIGAGGVLVLIGIIFFPFLWITAKLGTRWERTYGPAGRVAAALVGITLCIVCLVFIIHAGNQPDAIPTN